MGRKPQSRDDNAHKIVVVFDCLSNGHRDVKMGLLVPQFANACPS